MALLNDLLVQRTPPANLEAERAVLGALLLDRTQISRVVDRLRVQDFYLERHRKIYGVMLDLFQRDQASDLLTVSEGLRVKGELEEAGGPAMLAGLADEAALRTSRDNVHRPGVK